MLPAVVVSVGLLAASQLVFLRMSFFCDRGFGLVDAQPTPGNYLAVVTDGFYLGSLYLTLQVALIVVA
jgi:ABC-type spermidine/putrescine transport system permease subunit I